jgi:ArsR family metal-binding transcriptional regulator
MPGNPNEIKVLNNAMANVTRRKIMNFLADGDKNTEEIVGAVGKAMLDFHIKVLQQASLIEFEGDTVRLSKYGKNFLKDKAEKDAEKIADLSQAKPVEIAEIRQLLPCIVDSSKFRVIANMAPPLGGILKILEPIFPRSNYSDRKDSLIVQKGEIITTIYGSGKVSMRMIQNEDEAREELENIRNTINEVISKGVASASREKIRVDFIEIYKYLPQTNCGKCGEQGCYTFAIRLMADQVTLNKCILLKEPEYVINQEHLQFLAGYI